MTTQEKALGFLELKSSIEVLISLQSDFTIGATTNATVKIEAVIAALKGLIPSFSPTSPHEVKVLQHLADSVSKRVRAKDN